MKTHNENKGKTEVNLIINKSLYHYEYYINLLVLLTQRNSPYRTNFQSYFSIFAVQYWLYLGLISPVLLSIIFLTEFTSNSHEKHLIQGISLWKVVPWIKSYRNNINSWLYHSLSRILKRTWRLKKVFGFLEYFGMSKLVQFPLVRKNKLSKSEEPTIDVLLVKVLTTENIHYFSRKFQEIAIKSPYDLLSAQEASKLL